VADYDLYYWPAPFRGQFIRAILAYAGKSWSEHDSEAIGKLMTTELSQQPIPLTGPPVLIQASTGIALAQMPAIALYLGETLGLIPDTAAMRAHTMKVVNDANDVIDELTLDGGREMWTRQTWDAFVPRLERWMMIWEETGRRGGLMLDGGFLLGTPDAGVADIVTSILWSTMADRFSVIADLLKVAAPSTAGLAARMQAHPSLSALDARAHRDYGNTYCGGQIEKSLLAVAGRSG
jgi:glutathione S-transferase